MLQSVLSTLPFTTRGGARLSVSMFSCCTSLQFLAYIDNIIIVIHFIFHIADADVKSCLSCVVFQVPVIGSHKQIVISIHLHFFPSIPESLLPNVMIFSKFSYYVSWCFALGSILSLTTSWGSIITRGPNINAWRPARLRRMATYLERVRVMTQKCFKF